MLCAFSPAVFARSTISFWPVWMPDGLIWPASGSPSDWDCIRVTRDFDVFVSGTGATVSGGCSRGRNVDVGRTDTPRLHSQPVRISNVYSIYSVPLVKGRSAMCRARLMALATLRCWLALVPSRLRE